MTKRGERGGEGRRKGAKVATDSNESQTSFGRCGCNNPTNLGK